MAKQELDEKKTAPSESAAVLAAKQLRPEETRPVKRVAPSPLPAAPLLGQMVFVRLGAGRSLRDPNGLLYDPAQIYYLLVTVTLLRQIRHGDWVLFVPDPGAAF